MYQDIDQLFDNNATIEEYDDFYNINSNKNFDIPKPDLKDKSDIDKLFNSLTSDVSGATNFISDIMKKKDQLDKDIARFEEEKEIFKRQRKDFKKFINLEEHKIAQDREHTDEYIRIQREQIKREEEAAKLNLEKIQMEMDNLENEYSTKENKMKVLEEEFENYRILEQQKLDDRYQNLCDEKNSFDDYQRIVNDTFDKREQKFEEEQKEKRKHLEEEIKDAHKKIEDHKKQLEIKYNKKREDLLNEINYKQKLLKNDIEKYNFDKEQLKREQEQFKKYQEVEKKKIVNKQLILDSEKLQFDTYKTVTEKKLEIANKDLDQKCDKFKEVMRGFQVKFDDLREEE